jgi:glucosamine--fructose-6-phosphate aminotransferase (isomerizing)
MASDRGVKTQKEILDQFDAWEHALSEVLGQEAHLKGLFECEAFAEVIFTGCGSTHYLSLTAAAIFQHLTGLRALGLPASELVLFPSSSLVRGEPTLLVAVSRSGETTETLWAVRDFKASRGETILAITCYEDSTLASDAPFSLISRKGKEESIAQTRSFSSMLVAAQALAGIAAGRNDYLAQLQSLPPLGERLIAERQGLARELGEDARLQRFFFLGSGPRYGLACEAMLKMKEMSLSYSEAFHFMEFRHGPKSMVDETTLVVGLLSDSAQEHELAVLKEVKELGARTLALAESADQSDVDHLVCFDSGLPELAREVLYLPVLQLLAYYRAIAKGLNPDRPTHLDAVVRL